MNDPKEIRQQIGIKLAELRLQAHFACNEYDYHQKNDGLDIIGEQMDILNRVSDTYTQFLNEMQKFKQTIDAAKQLSGQVDQLLRVQLQLPDEQRQHEIATPKPCTKDKFKDNSIKKQLFPPA